MSAVLNDAVSIKSAAAPPMLDLYRDTRLERLPDPGDPVGIWAFLKPAFIEICDRGYYGDDRICIMIVFQSRDEVDFMPAIETTDGRFAAVLSGT